MMQTIYNPSCHFRWGVASDVGKVRVHNEDAYAIEPEAGLFMVSDGMGGHQGGELASDIVTQDLPPAIETALHNMKGKSPRAVRRLLKRWIAEQSWQLRMEGHSESGYRDMGATLVLALLLEGRAYIANLGDSRAYRLRHGRLVQLSRDHSVVAELVEQGHITSQEAEHHEDQGVITQYAGMDKRARSHVRSFALQQGDRLLLCSDGLTDMVDKRHIRQVLTKEAKCQPCCDTLVALANKAGGHDNITVVVIEWLG